MSFFESSGVHYIRYFDLVLSATLDLDLSFVLDSDVMAKQADLLMSSRTASRSQGDLACLYKWARSDLI